MPSWVVSCARLWPGDEPPLLSGLLLETRGFRNTLQITRMRYERCSRFSSRHTNGVPLTGHQHRRAERIVCHKPNRRSTDTEYDMAVRTPGIAHYGIVLAIVLVSAHSASFRIAAVLDAAEVHQCVLIRLDDGQELSVRPFDAATIKFEPTSQGLVIWSAGANEGWQYLPPGSSWSRPRFVDNRRSAQVLLQSTRGEEADSGGSPSGQTTVQLDQLLGQVVVRGKTFLTPHNGGILHGRITVRRAPQSTSPEFPPAVALLRQGNTELARISFEEDQRQVTYDQNPLQKQLPDGLPPGEYTLRMEEGSESSAFTVEDTEWRDAVMALPNRFADLLGSPTDPLYLQITAEYLLGQVDKNATPLPY